MLHGRNVPAQTVHVESQVDPIFQHFFDADLLASYTSMMGCPRVDAVGSLASTLSISIEDDSCSIEDDSCSIEDDSWRGGLKVRSEVASWVVLLQRQSDLVEKVSRWMRVQNIWRKIKHRLSCLLKSLEIRVVMGIQMALLARRWNEWIRRMTDTLSPLW